MEDVEAVANGLWDRIAGLFTMEIYNGRSLADLLTLETLLALLGNAVGAALILVMGFVIAGIIRRRVARIGAMHASLDDTLFVFLGNIVSYVVLAFTALFVLNTFGVQTTSIVAVIGAAGLAIGLALQGTLANVAAGVMYDHCSAPSKNGDFVQVPNVRGR